MSIRAAPTAIWPTASASWAAAWPRSQTTLGDEWNNTIVIVVSEFGRTFRENGDRGTDHGHGSVYWVLGGTDPWRPHRRAAGRASPQANLFQDRDWPVLNDYRALIGGVLRKSYGLNQSQLGDIFPSAQPADLQLV